MDIPKSDLMHAYIIAAIVRKPETTRTKGLEFMMEEFSPSLVVTKRGITDAEVLILHELLIWITWRFCVRIQKQTFCL